MSQITYPIRLKAILLLILLTAVTNALAQSSAFTYQGKLNDNGATANGSFDLQFKLFDNATVGTGTQQGPTLTQTAIQVASGVFTVQLDFGTGVFGGSARYVEIGVRPAGSPNPYTVLSPRQRVTSSPYAIRSNSAASADTATNSTQLGGITPSGFLQNTTTQQAGANFNIAGDGTLGGSLSANTVNATTQYNIGGSRVLSIEGTFNTFVGLSAGQQNSFGDSNTFIGYRAGADNINGGTNTFIGAESGGSGVFGSTAIGFLARVTQSDSIVLGRVGGSVVRVGIGITAPVHKLHIVDPFKTGLRVQTNGQGGTVASFGGLGDFQIDSNGTQGGRLLIDGIGNVGINNIFPTARLHVIGNAIISGNLSKGGGSFKIDHPLDPENKYLYHSFVESPDMKNVYDGVVTLNRRGESVVTLPAYFEALNKDFRYQLTAVGKPGPGLYVAREINSNRFKIAGGTPGLKVSWQVTGIRKDAYANANRIQVEEDKPPRERGTLLHSDAFDQAKWGPSLSPNSRQHLSTEVRTIRGRTAGQ